MKVAAVSINPADWHFMRGTPYLVRLQSGVFKPKIGKFGLDMAGVVEVVGANVSEVKVGDEVFISDWLRNRNTIEFPGIWERIHNPDFNYGEVATVRSLAGLNNYKFASKSGQLRQKQLA